MLPDSTKPLPEPMLTYQQVFCGIHLSEISQEVPINIIWNKCVDYTFKIIEVSFIIGTASLWNRKNSVVTFITVFPVLWALETSSYELIITVTS